MAMAVMQIRKMWVGVYERGMAVTMAMRLSSRIIGCVRMLVMFIMQMAMFVFYRIVDVLMLMPFDKMQIKTNTHEGSGQDE
ncbi:MAG: hypothetical protein KGO02_10435, partial [Alphaproteobacteria bacterium]|nr:hypothetical protein [Alphaproteobacteria bacterium]